MANINKPSYIFRYHTDSQGNLINVNVENSYQVSPVNNIVMLDQIPSETERLIIKGANNEVLTECFNMDEITQNTYYCDYNEGKVYFDATHQGKTKIISYYGRGLALISADRVFLPDSLSNGDVVETLQDLIDFGKECLELIKTLGNAVVIIQKLEKNIADGNVLNDKLVSNIAIATPLQASLNKDIKDALVFKDQLKEDVADGKVLNTQLNEIVNEGKVLKPELDQSLANAQGSIDKINSAGNKSYLISAEQWTTNTDNTISSAFTYRLKHDMNSENLQVNGLISGFSTIVPYKTLGVNEILLISDERVNMKVIINASYYNGGADIAEEVIDARKGESSLKGKIDKIDEQMDSIVFNTSKFGIVGDGTDETQKIINMFNLIPNNSVVKFDKHTSYISVSGGITLENKKNIKIDGNGVTIKCANTMVDNLYNSFPNFGKDSIIRLLTCNNIEIKNMNIDGNLDNRTPNTNGESQNCNILLMSSNNIRIENCVLLKAMTDGIHLFRNKNGIDNIPNNNIKIINCTIDSSRRNNISIVDGIDVLVENCTLINAGRVKGTLPKSNICIEPDNLDNTNSCSNIKLIGLICKNAVNDNISLGGSNAKNVYIDKCYCEGGDTGIRCQNYSQVNNSNHECYVTNSSFINSNIGVFSTVNNIRKLDGCNVKNNIVVGLSLWEVYDLIISNNKIHSNGGGIETTLFDDIQIINNDIKDNANTQSISNGGNYGIKLRPRNGNSRVRVNGNFIYNTQDLNKQKGLELDTTCISRADCNTFKNINVVGQSLVRISGVGNYIIDLNESFSNPIPTLNFSSSSGSGSLMIEDRRHIGGSPSANGNYLVGDTIYNTTPTSGSKSIVRWVCTKATPNHEFICEGFGMSEESNRPTGMTKYENGFIFYAYDTKKRYFWNGFNWIEV